MTFIWASNNQCSVNIKCSHFNFQRLALQLYAVICYYDIKWLKYLGGSVETGSFSSLMSVVNDDYRILTWKVCVRKWSWSIFDWQD